jgi:hypothetical protein
MKKLAFAAYPAIVAFSLLAAVSAHAQTESLNLGPTGPSANGLTRAQVQAELFKARADGSLRALNSDYAPVIVTTSERTRAEVRAEAIAANRSNNANRWYGEDSGSIALGSQDPTNPVTPVFAKASRTAK